MSCRLGCSPAPPRCWPRGLWPETGSGLLRGDGGEGCPGPDTLRSLTCGSSSGARPPTAQCSRRRALCDLRPQAECSPGSAPEEARSRAAPRACDRQPWDPGPSGGHSLLAPVGALALGSASLGSCLLRRMSPPTLSEVSPYSAPALSSVSASRALRTHPLPPALSASPPHEHLEASGAGSFYQPSTGTSVLKLVHSEVCYRNYGLVL